MSGLDGAGPECDEQRVLMFPRRKAGEQDGRGDLQAQPKRGRQPVAIDLTAVRSHFALPQQQAAQELGISLTSLKQVCRKLGLSRWPYRRASRPRGEKSHARQQHESGGSSERERDQAAEGSHGRLQIDCPVAAAASDGAPYFPLMLQSCSGPLSAKAPVKQAATISQFSLAAALSCPESAFLPDRMPQPRPCMSMQPLPLVAPHATLPAISDVAVSLGVDRGSDGCHYVTCQARTGTLSSSAHGSVPLADLSIVQTVLPSLNQVFCSSASASSVHSSCNGANTRPTASTAGSGEGISRLIAAASDAAGLRVVKDLRVGCESRDASYSSLISAGGRLQIRNASASPFSGSSADSADTEVRCFRVPQPAHDTTDLLENCPDAQAALQSLLLLQRVLAFICSPFFLL